jgi:hypothetical protein
MAYIGLTPVTNFLATFSERFSGNASDVQFLLSRAVARSEDLEVFIGTAQQLPSLFTAVGTELTFISPPASGTNNITVIYRAGALQTLDTTATSFPAGSAASPSVYYTSGTNTGIYWPSGTQVAIATQGVKRLQIDAATDTTSTTSGALQVSGGLGATGNVYAGGLVRLTDTTESSSTSTGGLVVSGGMGLAKNLNVGGDIQCTGDFTVAGTFTTTASDSLAINDPFLFLATGNSGDSADTGVIAEYFDGVLTRYNGVFRDVTDGVFKVFSNLTLAPSTTVDTANVSFSFAPFKAATITAASTLLATSTEAASSTTTGALQVTGGVGITGALYIGGNLEAGSGSINSTGSLGNVASIETSGTIRTTGRIWANANVISGSTTTGAIVIPNSGGLGVGGNVNIGGSLIVTANIFPASNNVSNIGSLTSVFNTVHARATTASYADVAERYTSDSQYEPGTVLHFGGDYEVSQCNVDHCARIAGVVSTNPAYLMNNTLISEYVVDVALLGRVPCKVEGTITKGDMLVSAGNGRARAEANPRVGSVVGKALENFEGESGVIEVVVGKH